MKRFPVLIITNSASDLSKLEFPEFRIVNTKSEDFKKFLADTEVPEFSFALEIKESFEEEEKNDMQLYTRTYLKNLEIKKYMMHLIF